MNLVLHSVLKLKLRLESRTLLRLESRTIPRVESRTLLRLESRTILRLESRTLLRLECRMLLRLESRTLLRLECRTLSGTGYTTWHIDHRTSFNDCTWSAVVHSDYYITGIHCLSNMQMILSCDFLSWPISLCKIQIVTKIRSFKVKVKVIISFWWPIRVIQMKG